MTDQYVELDAALENVIVAAREHLAAVKAADGRIDDDAVWSAYVALNNATHEYDELLLDAFGEVTPWDVNAIDPEESLPAIEAEEATDPYPQVISVRQRRDYRVPSVAALLKVAEDARRAELPEDEAIEPVETVGEAVLELLQSGDGSLSALDVPQLEPLDGLIAVAEVADPLDVEAFDETDGTGPFHLGGADRLVGRLDEHPFADMDDLADDDYDEADDDFTDSDDLDEADLDEESEEAGSDEEAARRS